MILYGQHPVDGDEDSAARRSLSCQNLQRLSVQSCSMDIITIS